jgi:hypothetical protein
MKTNYESSDLTDLDVYRCTGERIGSANAVYQDRSHRPAWVSVTTGVFSTHQSLVPLTDAAITPNRIIVVFSRDHIRDAPTVQPVGAHLTRDDEQSLNAHYGLLASVRANVESPVGLS